MYQHLFTDKEMRFKKKRKKTSQEIVHVVSGKKWHEEKYYRLCGMYKYYNRKMCKRMKQRVLRFDKNWIVRRIDRSPFSLLVSLFFAFVDRWDCAQWRQRKPIGHRFHRYRFEKKDSPWFLQNLRSKEPISISIFWLFPISLYEIFLYMRDSFKILFILSNKLNQHTKIIIDSIN